MDSTGAHRPRAAPGWGGARVLAIGHSTRAKEEFVELLLSNHVAILADVRTIPRSAHNPQFDSEALRATLGQAHIRYVHLPRLGGLRHPRSDSENRGWRNTSFRGFADYLLTPEFHEGLMQLRALAKEGPVALMCAEAVPWRCHRSLIADVLFAHGVVVQHVAGKARTHPHRMTPFARVEGRRVTYPAPEPELSGRPAGRGIPS